MAENCLSESGVAFHITRCYEHLRLLCRNYRVVCDANLFLHASRPTEHCRSPHALSLHSVYRDDLGWSVIFHLLENKKKSSVRLISLDEYVEQYLPVLHDTQMSDMQMLQHFSIFDGFQYEFQPTGFPLDKLLLGLRDMETASDWVQAWSKISAARNVRDLVLGYPPQPVRMTEIVLPISLQQKRRKKALPLLDISTILPPLRQVLHDYFGRVMLPEPGQDEDCLLCFCPPEAPNANWICHRGHVICYECIARFVELECHKFRESCRVSDLAMSEFRLRCPILDCSGELSLEDQMLMGIYEPVHYCIVGAKIRAGITVPKSCPNCFGINYLSRTAEHGADVSVTCRFCRCLFCTGCGHDVRARSSSRRRRRDHTRCERWWHRQLTPVPRASVLAKDIQLFRRKWKSALGQNTDDPCLNRQFALILYRVMADCAFRRCPDCDTGFVWRRDRCTHMEDRCGAQFCYACGKQLFSSKRDYSTYFSYDSSRVAHMDSSFFEDLSNDELSLMAHNWCVNPRYKNNSSDPEFIAQYFRDLARGDSVPCPLWLTEVMRNFLGSDKVKTDEDATRHFHNYLFYETFLHLMNTPGAITVTALIPAALKIVCTMDRGEIMIDILQDALERLQRHE